ncbi:MAG: glycoside hydrolase family 99-like domain-containing protein [Rhodocyclaceae bacterium]
MDNISRRARAIAFYLPQFYPIPENNQWWGNGFTEWANVVKARPLFKGHYQPHLPKDLGFYDLRVPEVREQQAELARYAGIEGFCYWHYWFGSGKKVLERVFTEVLESGKPDFPFCLGWANESWTGRWHGLDSQVIFEQTYPGLADYRHHFEDLLCAFKDRRYIEVDGRKLFIIYRPDFIPDLDDFLSCWNDLARQNGLRGFFFVSANIFFNHRTHKSMDGAFPRDIHEIMTVLPSRSLTSVLQGVARKLGLGSKSPTRLIDSVPLHREYSDFVDWISSRRLEQDIYPCVIPNWDNTPRSGARGLVLQNSSPSLFAKMIEAELTKISDRPMDKRLVFIKSWNEWAEGNYLEPDQRFGSQYLDVLREALLTKNCGEH